MKHLISLASCGVNPVTFKYSSQRSVFRHPQISSLPLMLETLFHTHKKVKINLGGGDIF